MTIRQVLGYLLVGGTCALLNSAILVIGDRLHAPLAASIAASFTIVCLVGYLLHAAVTFGTPANRQGLLRYILAMAASLPLSVALLWLFARTLVWPMTIAAPAATAVMLVINFLLSRWAVTQTRRSLLRWFLFARFSS